MKILLIHNYYRSRFIGGEDVVFKQEYEALTEILGKKNVFQYTGTNDNLSIWNIKEMFFSKKHYNNVKKIIENEKIDIVHIHNLFFDLTPAVIKAAFDMKIPVVQTLHNFRWYCPNGVLHNPATGKTCYKCVNHKFPLHSVFYKCLYSSRIYSLLIALMSFYYSMKNYKGMIRKFISLTDYQAELFNRLGLNTKHIAVKPNFGCNVEKMKENIKSNNYICVSRLDKNKGIRLLMDAWLELDECYVLTLIGNGELYDEIKDEVKNRKNIHITGKIERIEVFEYMKNSSFALMTSLMIESCPMTIVEAMSMGIPVIGTDIGTRRDFIEHKINGYLFKPNKDDLKRIVIESSKISQEDYEIMCLNAFNSSKKFEKSIIMKKLIDIYKEVL